MKKQVIRIEMPIEAQLEGLDKVVTELQKGLREGTTSIDLTKGMGKSFSRLIDSFKRDYATFTKLTEGGGIDFSRSAEGIKAGKGLIKTFEELQRIMGDISSKSTVDLKKMFPEAFDARIDEARDSLKGLLDNLDTLAQKRLSKSRLEDDINNLTAQVTALKEELVDETELRVKAETAEKTVEDLTKKFDELREKLGKEMTVKLEADEKELDKIDKELQDIEERTKRRTGFTNADKTLKYKGKTRSQWERDQGDGRVRAGALTAIQNYEKDAARQKELQKRKDKIEKRDEALLGQQKKGEKADWGTVAEALGKNNTEVTKAITLQNQYRDAIEQSKQAASELGEAERKNATTQKNIDQATGQIDRKTKQVEDLANAIQVLSKKTDLSALQNQLKDLIPDFSPGLLTTQEGLDKIIDKLAEMDGQSQEKLLKELQEMGLQADETAKDLEGVREGVEGIGEGAKTLKKANDEMESLKNSVLQFFSLTNAVQLFKQTVQSALNTVKKLDATMTEAAVVTEFSVSDMWDKLPEYAAEAQKLGVSINGMYQATTLYYQQGLKNNEAMAIGAETMKMGKIAAMDSTEATKAMTAALRGFNMELNETSATRVNDVYSQLAAVTAADTNQIATAMEKTASIAASANMEFETTAALLAQIIETTQEAPETAGTALKTIIARFSEVKSLKEQGLATGKDEEGEVIDVNKIQTALRSVGISMDEYFAGTEGLDDVLLRLSEKWGTLDFETQRYIATMAAGSRQQSRFIAMMSDYGRTTELVTAANNSAGASQKQFEKTLDSMETKLAKLKNAWDQFTMGLANNEILKAGIDILTTLVETLNKIIDTISGGNGLLKSIASLAVAFGGLKIGGNLIKSLTQSFGSQLAQGAGMKQQAEKIGKETGEKMVEGAAKEVVSPKSEAALFKSYKVLFAKVQSKLPSIQMVPGGKGGGAGAWKKNAQEMEVLRQKMDEVRISSGKQSAEWQKLHTEYTKLKRGQEEIVKGYSLQGAGLEKLDGEQQSYLKSALAMGKVSEQQLSIMGAEGAARYANALKIRDEAKATEMLTFAQGTEQNLRKGGLAQLFTEIGLRAMGKTTADGQAKGIWGVVTANLAEAKSWIVKNGAMLIGIATVAIFVAAIATLIIGITKLIKAFDEAGDLSKKLESINTQLQELSDQAAEASSKINEISDAKAGLEDLQDGFKNLTKGTKEWKEQLVKTNNQVLELINKYPTLSQFVVRGSEGQLDISEAGWDRILEQSYQHYYTSIGAQTSLQIEKNTIEQQQAFEKVQTVEVRKRMENERVYASDEYKEGALWTGIGAGATGGAFIGAAIGSVVPVLGTAIGALIGAGIGALGGWLDGEIMDDMETQEDIEREATGGLTQAELSKFAAAAAEQNLSLSGGNTKEEFKTLYDQMGFDAGFDKIWNYMTDLGTGFDSLANETYGLQVAQEAYTNSLMTSIAQADPELAESEFMEQIVEAQTDQQSAIGEKTQKRKQEILKDEDYVDKDGNATDELINKYAAATGETTDSIRAKIKDESLSADTMAQTVASKEENDKATKAMKRLNNELERLSNSTKVSEKQFSSLKNVLSTSGGDLTRENLDDIAAASGYTVEELLSMSGEEQKAAIEAYLNSIGTSLGQTETDYTTYIDNIESANDRYEDAIKKMKVLGLDLDAIDPNLDSTTTQGLANKIFDSMFAVGHEGNADRLMELMNSLMPEDLEQQTAFFTAIEGLDWTSLESIESFSDILRELGIVVNGTGEDVEKFEDYLKGFAGAASKLSEEERLRKSAEVYQIIESIRKGEQNKIFTEEQKTILEENWKGAGRIDDWLVRDNLGNWMLKPGKTLEQFAAEIKGEEINATREKIDTTEATYWDYVNTINKKEANKGTSFGITQAETYDNQFFYKKAKEGASQGTDFSEEDIQKFAQNTFIDMESMLAIGKQGRTMSNFKPTYDTYIAAGMTEGEAMVELGKYIYNVARGDYVEYVSEDAYDAIVAAGYTLVEGGLGGERYEQDKQDYQDFLSGRWAGDSKTYFGSAFGLEYNVDAGTISFEDIVNQIEEEDLKVKGEVSGFETYIPRETLESIGTILLGDAVDGEDNLLVDMMGTMSDAKLRDTIQNRYKELPENEQQAFLKTIDTIKESYFSLYTAMDSSQELLLENPVFSEVEEMRDAALLLRVEAREGGVLLEKFNRTSTASDKALQALTSDYIDNENALKGLNEAMLDNQEILTEENRSTLEYDRALQAVGKQLRLIYGENIITDSFLVNNRGLIERMVAGEEAAWDDFVKKISYSYKYILGDIINFYDYTSKLQDLEIGMAIDFDPSSLINAEKVLTDTGEWVVAITEAQIQSLGELAKIYGTTLTFGGLNQITTSTGQTMYSFDSITGVKSEAYSSISKNLLENISGDKQDSWKNPYDKFYNTLEKINEALRQREKLERRYQKLVEKGEATADKLTKNKKQQVAVLQREAELQNDIITGRRSQINKYIDQKGLGKYAFIGKNEFTGEDKLRIDWAAINKVKDTEKGADIEEYISQLEEWFGSIEEAQDALEDIEDTVDEIKNQGKDEYLELEQTIKDALIQSYQDQIDKLSEINTSINDANSKMIEAMQSTIEKERQARQNEETEEDITDKQQRLAYLQQDTSGANALEILQLQDEIEQAQEDYTDTLIDQKISDLQEQNDKAAEQRERQIDIAQQQLDNWVETGRVWEEVKTLMNAGLNPETGLVTGSKLEGILKNSENWKGMSYFQQLEWATDMKTKIANGLSWLQSVNAEWLDVATDKGSANNPDRATNQDFYDDGDPTGPKHNHTEEVQKRLQKLFLYSGKIDGSYGPQTKKAEQTYRSRYGLSETEDIVSHYDSTSYEAVTGALFPHEDFQKDSIFTNPKRRQVGPLPGTHDQGAVYGTDSNGVIWVFSHKEQAGDKGLIWRDNKLIPINHYKTGGLADYTGPAWLDGTKSRPELVLNARDTQNFIQLKDVLSSIMSKPMKPTENSGDISYDIDINVESIQEQADLDMIAKYIENKIVSSAGYRNNNLVNTRR